MDSGCAHTMLMSSLQAHFVANHSGISAQDLRLSLKPSACSESPCPQAVLAPLRNTIHAYTLSAPIISMPANHYPHSSLPLPSTPKVKHSWRFVDRDSEGFSTPELGVRQGTPGPEAKGKGANPPEQPAPALQPHFFARPAPVTSAPSYNGSITTSTQPIIAPSFIQPDPDDEFLPAPVVGYPADPSTHHQHHPPRMFGYYNNSELEPLRVKYLAEFRLPAQTATPEPDSTVKQERKNQAEQWQDITSSDDTIGELPSSAPPSPIKQPNWPKQGRKSSKQARLYLSPPSSQSSQ